MPGFWCGEANNLNIICDINMMCEDVVWGSEQS